MIFERYTEKARRVIFFARYEASQLGAPHIETEHVLLGLLRETAELYIDSYPTCSTNSFGGRWLSTPRFKKRLPSRLIFT